MSHTLFWSPWHCWWLKPMPRGQMGLLDHLESARGCMPSLRPAGGPLSHWQCSSPGLNREWAWLALKIISYQFSNNRQEQDKSWSPIHPSLTQGSVKSGKNSGLETADLEFNPGSIHFCLGGFHEFLYLSLLVKSCGYRPHETVRIRWWNTWQQLTGCPVHHYGFGARTLPGPYWGLDRYWRRTSSLYPPSSS